MSDDTLRDNIAARLDNLRGLAGDLGGATEPRQRPPEPRRAPHPLRVTPIAHKSADGLTEADKALIGQYADVTVPETGEVRRLRIYTVTVRRDGKVRAEMRDSDRTFYRTPGELSNVGGEHDL